MTYNFEQVINRKNTNSLKYDFALKRGRPADIIPLWVADMDFKAPAQVLKDLNKAVEHGIFGYSDSGSEYFDSIYNWFAKRFNWFPEEKWLVKTPGIVFAIAAAIRALTEEGDGVLIQRPVYYPFSEAITDNNRRLINNPLIYENGRYHINFDDFEEKIITGNVKLFVLCSPHNPVGRVWQREELEKLAAICLKHQVYIVSDEIHCDFVFGEAKHHIFLDINEALKDYTILCTAPSKTFNLAGLQVSNIFIPNDDLRSRFKEEMNRTGYSQLNSLGLVACQSAYRHGEEWLEELKDYLIGNINFVKQYLESNFPKLRLIQPEGTYLLWIDFSALGLPDALLNERITHRAKLWLDHGTMFGPEGQGFQRINIACPRSVLRQALEQLQRIII